MFFERKCDARLCGLTVKDQVWSELSNPRHLKQLMNVRIVSHFLAFFRGEPGCGSS